MGVKYYNLIGYLPLSLISFFERKNVKSVKLEYGNYIKSIKYCFRGGSIMSAGRVFIILNNPPVMRTHTGGHIKVLGGLAKFFIDHKIKVFFVIMAHPFKSNYGGKDLKIRRCDLETSSNIKRLFRDDLFAISGINKSLCNIDVIGGREKQYTLGRFMRHLVNSIGDYGISENDLVYSIGGKFGSDIFHHLIGSLDTKRIYLMMNVGNALDKKILTNYDLIMAGSSKVRDHVSDLYKKKIISSKVFIRQFYWESTGNKRLTSDENEAIDLIKRKGITKLLVSTYSNIHRRMNTGFIEIIYKVLHNNSDIGLLLIGSCSNDIMQNMNRLNTIKSQIVVLEFSLNLYWLYSSINKRFDVYYIFPRQSGGAQGTYAAALSGVPVTLYTNNDAEVVLPGRCFVNNNKEFMNRLSVLMSDSVLKLEDVTNTLEHIDQHNRDVEKFSIYIYSNKKNEWDINN